MDDVTDPDLHEQLADVLAGEESISDTLRFVCEQLKPTIQYDPLGLTLNLRQETKWLRANWRKPVELQIEHNPVPLTRQVQRALMKITHEALVNAVAHGKPTSLLVRLRYPSASGDALVLTIANDGPSPEQPIAPRPHHWGVRNMREYADSVGATIQWVHPAAGGTRVMVTLPPEITARVILAAQETADDDTCEAPPDPAPVGAMRTIHPVDTQSHEGNHS
jgi:signal transduction histidine kinase